MSEAEFVKLVSTALKSSGIENGETCVEEDRVLDVLKQLTSYEVTAQLLTKTNGGRLVKKLCKSRVDNIANAAKDVIKLWKAAVSANRSRCAKEYGKRTFVNPVVERTHSEGLSSDLATSLRSEPLTAANASTDRASATPADGSSSLSGVTSGLMRNESVSSATVAKTGNRVRDVARSKLTQLLQSESEKMGVTTVDSSAVAAEIEKAIYDQNGEPGQGKKYLTKFRTLSFNLKDPKNGTLRQRILRREILAEALVKLSSEELANDEKKRENDDIRKNKLRECERAPQQSATTDQFTCGKCKANECTYYQMQTRSADEPMTTFVTCVKCNNRWKC